MGTFPPGGILVVYDDAAFVYVGADFAGDHLDRHADLNFPVTQVGQSCGDHRSFFQLYLCHGIESDLVKTADRPDFDGAYIPVIIYRHGW